ncbi:MAG: diguanylate cyclase [Pseudomonadota bacterium]
MKALIIDRDEMAAEMMTSRLTKLGHVATHEPVKNEGIEKLSAERFDVVFIDPSPMTDAQAMTLNIKRTTQSALYLFLLQGNDSELSYEEVTSAGCNDVIHKPLDPEDFEVKVNNAARLQDYAAKLGDTSEDFPSAGGVIAKSAFNQLFLSAIDRSGRYNELAYILQITIDNFDDIKAMDGVYNAEYSASKMAYHVVRLRRMSDIIGQTGQNEYCLLLQPQNETEAIDAAKRFASSLDEFKDIVPDGGNKVLMTVRLLHLPSGQEPFTHTIAKYSEM